MEPDGLEAGLLRSLKNINLDAYERAHAEQDVRRAAFIVELASRAPAAIRRSGRGLGVSLWRMLKRAQPAAR